MKLCAWSSLWKHYHSVFLFQYNAISGSPGTNTFISISISIIDPSLQLKGNDTIHIWMLQYLSGTVHKENNTEQLLVLNILKALIFLSLDWYALTGWKLPKRMIYPVSFESPQTTRMLLMWDSRGLSWQLVWWWLLGTCADGYTTNKCFDCEVGFSKTNSNNTHNALISVKTWEYWLVFCGDFIYSCKVFIEIG